MKNNLEQKMKTNLKTYYAHYFSTEPTDLGVVPFSANNAKEALAMANKEIGDDCVAVWWLYAEDQDIELWSDGDTKKGLELL